MKIIRHTARDMRQALRAVREQLGEDAVILSSRRTDEGVEVTAAVDFDASTLESGGFTSAPGATPAAAITAPPAARASARAAAPTSTALALTSARPVRTPPPAQPAAPDSHPAYEQRLEHSPSYDAGVSYQRAPAPDAEWISVAAREAVAAHAETAIAQSRGSTHPHSFEETAQRVAPAPRAAVPARAMHAAPAFAAAAVPILSAAAPPVVIAPSMSSRTEIPVFRGSGDDPVEQTHAAARTPFGPPDETPAAAEFKAPPAAAAAATDLMGNELKTLRRMLETQLAHLAWNDLTRRAPVHAEMLRELTEIGIAHDLAEHLVRQLPAETDLTFARRFTIAGLSQYLRVTGDRWLDDGGRVAFVGATGVGKTTTLAKVAVRWVLRHGSRDLALVAGDTIRIGAQDQLQSLAQLLGVPVYTADKFENLPALLSGLSERLVLIDTPGSSARDVHLGNRLAVLANSASRLETALVLAASTQAGALEEAVKHFAPANPSCCVLTKLDEAVSLGGVLSILIRAKMPVSYVSEGQRVPEDLRPARALELVSAAIRLAKTRGAAADEDLLRRRFGKNAHGIT